MMGAMWDSDDDRTGAAPEPYLHTWVPLALVAVAVIVTVLAMVTA